jgi:tetratricopeptide (TPR) repeat protein
MELITHVLRGVALAGALLATGCATTGAERAAAPPAPAREAASSREPTQADVTQARAHHSLGLSYLRDGRIPLAIRELRSAEKLNPRDAWIQLALGEAYRQRGLLDDAERHVLRAVELDPGFQQARLTLSGIYIQREHYADAIAQSEILVEDATFPQPWAALTNQGYAELMLGRHAQARESLQAALDYNPKYWRALLNLGILDAAEGKREDAIERFQRVVTLDPGPLGVAEANYRIGELYISLGDRERAVQYLSAAAAQSPSGPWGRQSEDTLRKLR